MSSAAELEPEARRRIERYLDLMAQSPISLSSVRDRDEAWRVHVLDSLSAVDLPEIANARRIADLGSGAGFPGVVLAARLPEVEVDLVESVKRKCEFMQAALEETGIANARPVRARSEELAAGAGREAYDAVTARAVGPLPALAELASPLLRDGGALIAWKGVPDAEEEEVAAQLTEATAMHPLRVVPVKPWPESRARRLHVLVKRGPTPAGLPRRPGMARKRPLTAVS